MEIWIDLVNSGMLKNLVEKTRQAIISQKRALKSLSILVIVKFAVAGIGFITQVKIANTLGKETFGYIAYGVAIATYSTVIIRFGLDRTMVRDLIHYPDRFAATVKASLIVRFSLLALVIVLVIGWKVFQNPSGDISWGVILIIIANAAMSVDLQGVYDSWHKMTRHALYNLLQRGLYFLTIWYMVVTDPEILDVVTVGMAMFVSASIYLILQYSWAIRKLPTDSATEKMIPLAFKMIRANVYIWLATLAGLSFGPLNQLVLKHYHGTTELGGYAAAWMMVALASMFLAQIARIGNPATARITSGSATKQEKIQFLIKYASLMVMITLPVSVVVVFAPELVMTSLFNSEYISAAPALQIMGAYIVVFSLGQVAAQYMVSSRMDKTYTLYIFLGSGLGFALCLLLIPSMGGLGAAWALLISHGFSITLYWLKVMVSLK